MKQENELDCVGEGAADAVEGGLDLAGKTGHGNDSAEADEARDERVFDKVLTRFVVDQSGESIFEVLHDVFSRVLICE
jgi:hypothetical protein